MTDEFTTVFPPYYEGAEMARGNAGWENPPYYLTAYGLAVKHGYTGTEEEWLASLKGDPGPDIVIRGHYDTLAELDAAVTDPDDGDFYEVGSGDSQVIYYYSAVQEDWMPVNVKGPQGDPGPAGQDGAPGVDGADGKSAYEQAQEAGYAGTEAQFMQLLADLPGYTEQARLWAVAAGEEATAAEGYAEAAAESAAEAAQAVTGMVPKTTKVNGKALSADITVEAEDVPYDNSSSGLAADDLQSAIDELASEKQEAIDGGTITLSLSWSGSGPYTQTVTVSGATISSNSKVDLQPTPAQIAQLIADGVEAIVIENNAGTLTATAIGATPSTALTVQCTVTEVVA